ncbi:MAG: ectoine hydroxylase-related dioxygenase (phytanoyl-CoA dioxygenase family) [Candidatus Poriferisodalaceae bacterium]|jgi:ectoine hydroxylase-related dioxygenase (phytanoyl-CoA dioxygenase family)
MIPELPARHQSELDELGYTIVENVIDAELLDELSAEVAHLEAQLDRTPDNNRFEGNRTTRTYNLLAHGEIWQQVPSRPDVLALVEGVIGPECFVSSLASISLGPGERAQVIRADDQVQPLAKPHVATVCNSHGSTWYGCGANTTVDEIRVGIAMNYCAGWIRQQEDQQLGIAHEVAATFTPQLRQFCGFGMYRGLIGNIEKQSPAHLLFGDEHETQLWDLEQIET